MPTKKPSNKLTINQIGQISSSLLQGYLELFPPGDVVDKMTILEIKYEKDLLKHSSWQSSWAVEMYIVFSRLLDHNLQKRYTLLMKQLKKINEKQWEYEDAVRRDKTGKAALQARQNNDLRVKTKNKINKLFGSYLEVKKYQ